MWLLIWQIASLQIGEELFLPSPVKVVITLAHLIMEGSFWASIAFSLARVAMGFFFSLTAAVILASLASKWELLRVFLDPAVKTIKATPVASIVILILVWISSRNLSVVVSALIVFPVIYTNVLEGILNTDPLLLEMSANYKVSGIKRIRYIYLPSVAPYFQSAVAIAFGLCWKSAVAAEVIGLPDGSIGERLYEAKVYLSTPDLFAWTLVIIFLAAIFEKVLLKVVKLLVRRITR